MKLRHRILFFLGVTVIGLFLGIYSLSSTVLLRSYTRLEHQNTAQNVERASRAFYQLVNDVHEKSVDWAAWDDTYLFLTNHNKAYIASNLDDAALASMRIDLILYVDTRGRIFYAKTIKRLKDLKPPSPEAVLTELERNPSLLPSVNSMEGLSGVIPYPNSPLMLSIRPILTTKQKRPSHGWLVFGRYFDPSVLKNLAERTRLNVHFDNMDAPTLSANARKALRELSISTPNYIQPIDSYHVAGYTLIHDIHQQPFQILTVSQPRAISQQGVASIGYFLQLTLLVTVIFSTIIMLVAERFVLSRLSKLTALVDKIGESDSEWQHIQLPGRDVLSGLAEHINGMLDKLEHNALRLRESEEQLRVYNDNLEHAIMERTELFLHSAFHDTLTGLPNRALFIDRLAQAQARTERQSNPIAVLFIDLDNFKTINDTLGHHAGDHLLVTVAERLEQCVQPGDTVARLGGDEFTILLEGLSSVEDAIATADRIVEALRAPMKLPESEAFASCSMGIAYSTEPSDKPDGLLRDADTAMYETKANGKGGYTLFEPGMNDRVMERVELETALHLALDRQELLIHYQPLIDLSTGHLAGVEALIRWQHPERGLISPGKFIPIAEETGLILPIGYWVMEEACRQTKEWKEAYPNHGDFTVNVNLSGKQLQRSDVVQRVQEVLEKTQLPPASLKIEITESVIMADMEDAVAKLKQLKSLGVKLAMDDFGTGYSSMASLSAFPLDTVKIDRAFISRMTDQEEAASVVAAIIMLSKALR